MTPHFPLVYILQGISHPSLSLPSSIMLQPWGLYHTFENRLVAFSLLQVHAVVNIKDLAAEVKLTHTYCKSLFGYQ
ncbi:hypothetical protein R3P38DRAFT_2931642 [Favolaschia claudopus]|uniref:Uncharacterized protein n=1 Tax=Favolaschia claudopus TaxID=2862362 RepID=A0AAW0BSD4_9AGAR